MTKTPSTLVPAMKLCEQMGINRRTLDRRMTDESLDFPEPIVINGRLYFEDDKIEAWKRQRAAMPRTKRSRIAVSTPELTAA